MATRSVKLMQREPTHREHMEAYAKMIWNDQDFRHSDLASKNAYLDGMSMGSKAEAVEIIRGWLALTSAAGGPTVTPTPTWTIPADLYGIRVRFVGEESGGNISLCGIHGTLVAKPASLDDIPQVGLMTGPASLFVQHGERITFAKAQDLVVACQVCGKDGLNRCSGCRKIFFCSARCQRKCWKTHKAVCTSSKKTGEESSNLNGGQSASSAADA